MIELVKEHRGRIHELCVRYRVRRLDVFGSAATGAFRPERSDLDFLVEFDPMEPFDHGDCYFGLLFALEDLTGRHVDLVEATAPGMDNPYFAASVNETREVLYAA
jgi:hypothetical protein